MEGALCFCWITSEAANLYVGSEDAYFLNDAVYLMEDFLNQTDKQGQGVPSEGEVRYGPRAEHCWNGDNQMCVPQIMERIQKIAPKGSDLTSWRY